jgi:hypothetical protein
MSEKSIQVTVLRNPGNCFKVVVPEGSTVEVAFRAEGISLNNDEGISVNGEPAKRDTVLQDNDCAIQSAGAKGAI